MRLKKDLLQKLANGYGEYFIGNKESTYNDYGHFKSKYEAVFFSPNVPNELRRVENIGECTFELVETFANEETHTNIYLGAKQPSPFQWGIRHSDFVDVTPTTCDPMELIIACYENNITDYYEVLKKMKELTEKKIEKEEHVFPCGKALCEQCR